MTPEKKRLEEDFNKEKHWRRWGPYLTERQWGTVREVETLRDNPWKSLSFQDASRHAYQWGEDGIGGVCDNHGRLCLSWTFWNGKDPILKERLFGLSNLEGNHGEDVKELYYYLDNTPTHSYMRFLYKYPQNAFPYEELIEKNRGAGPKKREFELIDTGIFDHNAYFDIFVIYAKEGPEDIVVQVEITNRFDGVASLDFLPTLWFRHISKEGEKALITKEKHHLEATHPTLGNYTLHFEGSPQALFTDNVSQGAHSKGAFHDYVIGGNKDAVAGNNQGTKAALWYCQEFGPYETKKWHFRLTNQAFSAPPLHSVEGIVKTRKQEADQFYNETICKEHSNEHKLIERQAFAGLLWNKAYYNLVIEDWNKRNAEWSHLHADDVLSVPDKWEYPAFYSWDTAFQSLPLAMIDPAFAKKQLELLTREWYMHPNGQIPSYEWAFSDVNPPVHAWASWRTYKIEGKREGKHDRLFLERVFQKLLLNFTWWVNRKDQAGKNIFEGGFLGLDNISIFNRSEKLPGVSELAQSDATSWMGMYCLNMLEIALELAKENVAYEDMASKFFEHFLYISEAINLAEDGKTPLWDEEDGFFYDVLKLGDGSEFSLKIRSMVGLVPLFAVATLTPDDLARFDGFAKRLGWFVDHRSAQHAETARLKESGVEKRKLLSIVGPKQLRRILEKVLDPEEFLSPYGIRSLSKYHKKHPYVLQLNSHDYTIGYEPAESQSPLFGGNSNWRGPIWFPLNMLLIESLQKFHHYYGDDFKVECPTGSGNYMNLWDVGGEISKRLISLFTVNQEGKRPVFGEKVLMQTDPHFNEYLLFHEYFNGDTGEGLGASHQTGWTALIAKLIAQYD